MIEAGKTLQRRYRIERQIGQGGMGAVYVATDERFGSVVAIKETLCMDDSFRKAIEREARLLNSLKHIALPRVSDHFEEDGSLFLVMEYIPGEDLCCVLDERGKPFPVDEMLRWGDQLLDALDFLHNQETPVIHRDIKPQNLKLTPQGQVILLDFGLAKGNPTDASHQTAAKSIFGYSRNYASLEQIQGTGTDPRSDLYSLAATLYHLLTGTAPEDALTRAMSVLSQKPDPLVPANLIRPEIPRGVAGVLQKALDLNAGERPGSASEMRQMLRESERYAYLADVAAVASTPTDAQVFVQKTKMMPEGTRTDNVLKTDVKTEVMPAHLSEPTFARSALNTDGGVFDTSRLQNAAGITSSRSRWSVNVAAAVAGMLLIGGAVAGGIYTFKPSIFGIESPASNESSQPDTSVSNVSGSEPSKSSLETGPISDAGTLESRPPGSVAQADSASGERSKPVIKQDDTAKSAKPASAGQPGQNEIIDIRVPQDESIPGDMVITKRNPDGTTTTTRIMKAGPPAANGQSSPAVITRHPEGVDLRNLTPAQRRRLKEAIRRNGGVPPYPIPQKPQ